MYSLFFWQMQCMQCNVVTRLTVIASAKAIAIDVGIQVKARAAGVEADTIVAKVCRSSYK